MAKTLVAIERRARNIKTGDWWWVDRTLCSFHRAGSNGGIYVRTSALRRALATLDRQLAKQRKDRR